MRRTFQYNELPWPQCLGDRTSRPFNIAEIRIATFIQWRRNADNDAVCFTQTSHVGRRFKAILLNQSADRGAVNMLDVTVSSTQLVDLRLIDVKADCLESTSCKRSYQR